MGCQARKRQMEFCGPRSVRLQFKEMMVATEE